MTKFISTVRFTVKDDCVDEFIKREKELDFTGMAEQITLIKTGDTTFCWIGVFESEDAIANCRLFNDPTTRYYQTYAKKRIKELGVTDPASGELSISLTGRLIKKAQSACFHGRWCLCN